MPSGVAHSEAAFADGLHRCFELPQALVIELTDRGFTAIQPSLESDDNLRDDLIDNNPASRGMLANSIASPRETPELPNP